MYAYVACMAVRKDYRRKGIASELLKAAEIQVHSCILDPFYWKTGAECSGRVAC